MSDELVFYRKSVRALDKEEYAACVATNFGRRGMMQETLREAHEEDYLKGTAFMLWRGKGKSRVLLSWALRYWSNGRWNVYVYTRTTERRKGYGALVLKEAKRGIRSELAVHPWDKRSLTFYGNFKQSNIVNARAHDNLDWDSEGYAGIV